MKKVEATSRLVLADASPLIALASVGGLAWLHELFGTISLTAVIRREVLPGRSRAGEREIADAIERGWLDLVEGDWQEPSFAELDEGEASVLRAAVNLQRPCLLLIDERAGRATARDLGFAVTGTAGVILAAKRRGLIPEARAVFQTLLAKDFRLSAELIRAVLEEAGES